MLQLIRSIDAHKDKVWCVKEHQSLPIIATASTDRTCKVYDLSKHKNFPLLATLEDTHKRSVRSVDFKPPLAFDASSSMVDLPVLACGSFDSTISIWGIEEPDDECMYEADHVEDEIEKKALQEEALVNPKNEWSLMAIIEGHENEVKSVAWNYQGNLLASCSRDKTIWIWETDPETLEEFECISVLSEHQHDIKHVVWHPKCNLLASSSYDDTIRLYEQDDDNEDWTTVGILNGHRGTVWCSQFEHPDSPTSSPDKTRLVSCSDDSTVRIWSSETPYTLHSSNESSMKEKLPSSIKASPQERIWEEEILLPPAHQYAVYSVAWSKASGRISSVGSDGKIVVYKQQHDKTWSICSIMEGGHGVFEINCVSWCTLNDGREVLVTAGDDGRVNIWNLLDTEVS